MPEFVATFARLARLAPPGSWPAVLPTTPEASKRPRPLALGIGARVDALLPEAERAALHDAIGLYTRSAYYLEALAADEARRWSDDGARALEPVSPEHRRTAAAVLLARAARKLAKGARG
jgi:hypothetical protein